MGTASHRALVDRRAVRGAGAAGVGAAGVGGVAVGVLAAGAGAGLLLDLAVTAVQHWRAAPPGAGAPAQLLTGVSAGAAGLLLAWLTLAAALTLLTVVGGELGRRATPVAARIAPTALRATVVALVGGSLAVTAGVATTPTGAAGPTLSGSWQMITSPPGTAGSTTAGTTTPTTTPVATGLVTGRPAPDRSADPAVVVRAGDTLWAITARHIGPDATAVQVAREWPRWFAANRGTIGDDPDLLRPGQRLVPPQ